MLVVPRIAARLRRVGGHGLLLPNEAATFRPMGLFSSVRRFLRGQKSFGSDPVALKGWPMPQPLKLEHITEPGTFVLIEPARRQALVQGLPGIADEYIDGWHVYVVANRRCIAPADGHRIVIADEADAERAAAGLAREFALEIRRAKRESLRYEPDPKTA
jgi:hypothetical protein